MSEPDTTPTGSVDDATSSGVVEAFIGRWKTSGGSELANFQTFANELCHLLRVERPEPSQAANALNDYV